MRLLIQHKSHYRYPEPATLGPHTIRLRPTAHTRARIETYRLQIEQEHRLRWQQDPYGNHVARVHFPAEAPVRSLDVLVELTVEIRPVNPFDFLLEEFAAEVPFAYPPELARELAPFLVSDDPAFDRGARYAAFDAELPRSGPTTDLLNTLNQAVNRRVRYVIREEAGVYTPEEALAAARASCRDSAVLMTALLRDRGLATRFVSGYLVQLTDEGMLPDEPRGVTRDVVDLHAWCEVYLPGAGWVGLDATSGLFCGEGHIPLCGASTPALASPLEGTCDVGANEVGFEMIVGRLGHEPRPTTPYTSEVWSAMQAAAGQIDARLAQAGIALTMGGEPTFNSREAPDAPEWNGEALGATKWTQGMRLTAELRARLAPTAVVLHRQGKWYPGESLPRWAMEIIARRDGVPLWGNVPVGPAPDAKAAERFGRAFAARLGVVEGLQPAFEDPWHVLQDEARTPIEVDAARAELDDPEERRRLARALNRGINAPTGWVLPLAPSDLYGSGPNDLPASDEDDAPNSWCTELWEFRRGALFLIPGDSPIGLRLPLGSLGPGEPPMPFEEPVISPPDPRREAEFAAAAARQAKMGARAFQGRRGTGIRSAICFEVREGALRAFLPPLPSFGRFVRVVRALDRTRVATGLDVLIEGYGPPPSPAAFKFAVTPDPGVLEVNIPPVTSLGAFDKLIDQVFDAALHSGLHSEKYLLDGRMAGSGGGNHLTFGGASALESPFIRRPDILGSLLTFVQHHPSLSYLFASLFVGPTSQAPRVDEARHETLYELEIALARAFQGTLPGQVDPPWLSDMLFRHLLVDMTGNTHRTEISIDKLFDPGTSYGRQGIVELRAFEMPPHPRMVTAQAQLVRALIAAFVEAPYQQPLVRWGSALHDRFMLPYNLWRDLEDVLGFLRLRGLPLPADGYRPFLDLRCPLAGTLQAGDVTVEIRNALEPWHVLGEEMSAGGTSRYVDSSLERIEVRVKNLTPDRHVVLVNGYELPLHATPTVGEAVAGIRFRAWAPAHSLHAHIGIHHPVRLEVIDVWAKRSLGGAAYHVWHPEGRAFDTPPLTRFEAAARRAQRFTHDAHSPWPVVPLQVRPHPDQPWTLDLRRLPIDRPMPRAYADPGTTEGDR